MSVITSEPDGQQRAAHQTDKKGGKAKYNDMAITYTVISLLAFAIGVGCGINLFFYALPHGNVRHMIIGAAAVIIFSVIGAASYALGQLPTGDTPRERETDAALKTLANKTNAELRPYMAVSYVQLTNRIGQPFRVELRFTNTGKTPAEDVGVFIRFTKVPIGGLVDRSYDDGAFVDGSRGDVGVGQTIETTVVGHELTAQEDAEWRSGFVEVVAYGAVRYHSKYIDGGQDDLPFCYEFDPGNGDLIACRPLLSKNNPRKKN